MYYIAWIYLFFPFCSERTDPSGTITKTTRVIKTTKHSGGQQPINDDVETFNPTDYSTLQSTAKYSNFQDNLKRDEYQTNEKPYTLGKTPYENLSVSLE